MPLVRDEEHWRQTGRRVFKMIVIAFAFLGLLAGLAVARSGNTVHFGALSFDGWSSVGAVTVLMAAVGALFGAVWLLIFRALALASRR